MFFFLGFIESKDHRLTEQRQLTHRRPGKSIIIFERLDKRNTFILYNANRAVKTYNYTSVYHPKSILISRKHIRRSQLFIFLVLETLMLYSSRDISKLLSAYGFFFFSVHSVVSIIQFHVVLDLPKQLFVAKA